ncbi:MAG: hypothetical protein QM296_00545 [Bacillota bacterium]|nr:hypothetical protein [Bacillota bacterium]
MSRRKFKFELNREGVGQLLKSEEMQAVLQGHASAMRDRCGEGYEDEVLIAPTRAIARVRAETAEARRDNAENNTALKAVRG